MTKNNPQYSTRDKIGISIFIIAVFFSIFLFFDLQTASNSIIGPADAGLSGLFILLQVIFAAGLFFISLLVGWRVKFIKYTLLSVIGLFILLLFFYFLREGYSLMQGKSNQRKWQQQKTSFQVASTHFHPLMEQVKDDPIEVSRLLAEMRKAIQDSGVKPNFQEYYAFEANWYLYLYITQGKPFDQQVNKSLTYINFYTDFYEENMPLFTAEVHYLRLFQIIKKNCDKPLGGMPDSDIKKLLGVIGQADYPNAFLGLFPFISKDFTTDDGEQYIALKTAAEFTQRHNNSLYLQKMIKHTQYHYSLEATPYPCELDKILQTYQVVKQISQKDSYLELAFQQMKTQCTGRRWGYFSQRNKSYKELFCYIKDRPGWLETFKMAHVRGSKIEEYMFEEAYCQNMAQ